MSATFTPGQRVTVQGVPDLPAAEGATGTVSRIVPDQSQGRTVAVTLDASVTLAVGSCRRFLFSPDELEEA